LELYIEITDAMIEIYEEKENYERCQKLKEKKDFAIKIINEKTI
jgi:hypothetical protein